MNREELAWAAGFFDGEGSCYAVNHKLPRLSIAQAGSPETLERFRAAVGGRGVIRGPTEREGGRWQPIWQYTLTCFEDTQAAICMLWPWLCGVKRAQARRVFLDYFANGKSRKKKLSEEDWTLGPIVGLRRGLARTHCLRGHPLTEDNVYVSTKGRCCKKCKYIRNIRDRAKQRAKKAAAGEEA